MDDFLFVMIVMVGPAVVGIAALILGIVLLRRARAADAGIWPSILGTVLLLVFFGIALCYALVLPDAFRPH